MRNYYFCTQFQQHIDNENEQSIELLGDRAAWAMATAEATKFLAREPRSLEANNEWRIDVQDGERQPLYAIRIVFECYQIDL